MSDKTEYGTFDELLSDSPPALAPACKALRQLVTELHPQAVEIVWSRQRIASYGVGPRKMTEHYVYIAPQTHHVNLGFYHGIELDDPDSRLEGTGKRLRHIKIRSTDDLREPAISALVAAAIAERTDALD